MSRVLYDGPVSVEETEAGYHRVRSCGSVAYIHQLVAIAEGVTPELVFSDGDYQVHHRNRLPWGNWWDNLDVLTRDEHQAIHADAMDESNFPEPVKSFAGP